MNYFNRVGILRGIIAFSLALYGASLFGKSGEILIVNEDDSRFYGAHKPNMFTEEGIKSYVSRFEGTNLSHFFMCPNAQRAAFDSKVRQPIWAPASVQNVTEEQVKEKIAKRKGKGVWVPFAYSNEDVTKRFNWPRHAKLVHDRGLDAYKIWIDECRRIDISPWITMRMNDMHFPDDPEFIGHDIFWQKHPELRRTLPGSIIKRGGWARGAFNYKHKEVRDYQMAFVKELFERYDFDGFEMDWMRFDLHLTPNKGEEESHFITDFVRDVKKLALEYEKKRGHKIEISVRVHSTPDASKYVGLDAVEWAKEGLVDIIVPSVMSNSDYNCPSKEWKLALGDAAKNVKIVPGAEEGSKGFAKSPRAPVDLPALNGWAENCYYNGADGLYFFNLIYHQNVMMDMMNQGMREKVVRNLPRRHIVSFRDFSEPRDISDKMEQLPKETDKPCDFLVLFGRKPDESARGELSAVITISNKPGFKEAKLDAFLNGVPAEKMADEPDILKHGGLKNGKGRAIRYFFPYSALKSGYNKITVRGAEGDIPQIIVWVELDTKPPEGK